MAKTGVKNKWQYTHGFVNRAGAVVLRFKNATKNARYNYKVVEIPVKGKVLFTYQIPAAGRGYQKTFTRKRTKALLAKYGTFKKYIV
jgi:hypothetical protein